MVKNKAKKIIVILILIDMLFPYMALAAASADQQAVGTALALYAYSFCMRYGANSGNNQTVYDHDDAGTTDREYGYKLLLHSGIAQRNPSPKTKSYTNKYPMDCVGFVSTMLHQSLGIGGEHFTFFITPSGPKGNYFTKVTGEWEVGDVLQSDSHVLIYLGKDGMGGYNVAHSTSADFKGAEVTKKTQSYFNKFTAYRIAQDLATTLVNSGDIKNVVGGSLGGFSGSAVMEESEFYYNGVPDGKYSVAGNFWEWIVQSLADIFAFLINIVAYIFRMVPVGFTAIIENLITYVVTSITGEEFDLMDDSTKIDSSGDITVESIIFGRDAQDGSGKKVDVFNVNFFEDTSTTTP